MIDERGQSGPIPVVMVRREMKEHDPDELRVQGAIIKSIGMKRHEDMNEKGGY